MKQVIKNISRATDESVADQSRDHRRGAAVGAFARRDHPRCAAGMIDQDAVEQVATDRFVERQFVISHFSDAQARTPGGTTRGLIFN